MSNLFALQPCGGAIPICMVDEFDLPMEIIDRRVTKMKMISPSNREVDVGKTLNEKEWIGMCRREVRLLTRILSCCPLPWSLVCHCLVCQQESALYKSRRVSLMR